MKPAATFSSSAGYSRSAMIDDGCSRKFNVKVVLPLHPGVGDRATGQPFGQDRRSILEVACKVWAPKLSYSTLVSIELEEELQLGVTKAVPAGEPIQMKEE